MQPAASKTLQQTQNLNPARVAARGRGSELPRSRPAATREVAAVRSPDLRGLELRVRRIQRGRERDGTGDDDAVAGGLDGLELREVVRHGRRRSRGV